MGPHNFTLDDRPVPFVPGQSIGAALLAHEVTALRSTRGGGRSRGLFCGIGICFDCLVTVNGVANQRACQVLASDSLQVHTQEGTGHDA